MKTISIAMLVLLGGALISSLLIQGVTGRPSDTKLDYEVVSDTDTDIEREYRENDLSDGNDKREEKRDFGLSAAAISAAAAAVSAGTSLVGTSMSALMSTGHNVVCGIEIDNFSKWLLRDAQTFIGGGHISTPARDVQPSKREAMVAHKTSNMATGTYGTVSWLVSNGKNKRIIVMWSVPYSHDSHSNWLAVGIIEDGSEGEHWFDQMYYRSGPFVRAEYYYNSKSIDYCEEDMCLTGTMGTSHKPKVAISFYPMREEDLAPEVKALV